MEKHNFLLKWREHKCIETSKAGGLSYSEKNKNKIVETWTMEIKNACLIFKIFTCTSLTNLYVIALIKDKQSGICLCLMS